MLKFILCFLISLPAFACLGVNVEGKLAVDGQTWKLNRTMKLGHEEKIPVGPYILSIIVTHPGKELLAKYKLEEKKGISLVLVTQGEEDELEIGKVRDIMAKGEEGQPNSIITLKLNDI